MTGGQARPARLPRRAILRAGLGFGVAGAVLAGGFGPVVRAATDREAAYDALLETASALAAIEPVDSDRRRLMRATAVKLARRLKGFLVSETEIRSEDKVGAPPGADRPADPDPDGPETAPGAARIPLDSVPTPWFARQATEARRALDALIRGLDRGDMEASRLMLRAERVADHLRALARPPESRR